MGIGIVHFGPGAFHRAHQADYINRLLGDDPRWGIAAVSLRTAGTIDALRQQDGRYTLAILDHETSFRTIKAHRRFYGPDDCNAVRQQLSNPDVKVVSTTVTEKGYCLAGDGTLDFNCPDIVHDLARPREPVSLVGWLGLGLSDRWRAGLQPFTPLCCDNMASNGKKLRSAVLSFAQRIDGELASWIEGEVRFPDTVVDSITPATDERLRQRVLETTGFDDAIPVGREAYSEWVIEDALPESFPDLRDAGATITGDIAAWEKAKLRILNGAHSTLAYLGLLLGRESVAEAMGDADLSAFLRRLVCDDIVPGLAPSPLNLCDYADQTFERFRNPAIHHRLTQIAWDGSQKLPYRLIDSILNARSAGRPVDRLAIPVAAWLCYIERQVRDVVDIVDPLAGQLRRVALSDNPVAGVLELHQIFPKQLAADPVFRDSLTKAFAAIRCSNARMLIAADGATA